jgi:hypothetical protein
MVLNFSGANMAEVILHPTIRSLHGKMGDVVFRKTPSGKQSMIKRADMSNVEWSDAQQDQRQRFKEANAYAKAAMADETLRLIYETVARKRKKNPYRLAFSDYFDGKKIASGEDSTRPVSARRSYQKKK